MKTDLFCIGALFTTFALNCERNPSPLGDMSSSLCMDMYVVTIEQECSHAAVLPCMRLDSTRRIAGRGLLRNFSLRSLLLFSSPRQQLQQHSHPPGKTSITLALNYEGDDVQRPRSRPQRTHPTHATNPTLTFPSVSSSPTSSSLLGGDLQRPRLMAEGMRDAGSSGALGLLIEVGHRLLVTTFLCRTFHQLSFLRSRAW